MALPAFFGNIGVMLCLYGMKYKAWEVHVEIGLLTMIDNINIRNGTPDVIGVVLDDPVRYAMVIVIVFEWDCDCIV